jgi:hypothetical protein
MSIRVVKAEEAVAKGVLKGTTSAPRIPLQPRAVTVEEAKADTFLTHKKSIDSTMTPWKGWFQRWVADTLAKSRYQQIRSTLLFMPDDIYDLQQSPKPDQAIPTGTDPPLRPSFVIPVRRKKSRSNPSLKKEKIPSIGVFQKRIRDVVT